MNDPRYNRISIVLDEFGIDQKDLAKLIKVSKDTVSRWCRNENQPRIPELYRIAKVFRIDICRFLVTTDWKNETGMSPVEILKAEKEKSKQKSKSNKNKAPDSFKKKPSKK